MPRELPQPTRRTVERESRPSAFPVRFKDPGLHYCLSVAADASGARMTDLAEAFIAQGLSTFSLGFELEMEQTLADLRRRPAWTAEDARRDAEAFAEAEVTERDPLRSTMRAADEDPFGIAAAFGSSLG